MTAPQPCSLCARPEPTHDDAACSFGWTPALPPLRVWTARISYRGADRLDITRAGADTAKRKGARFDGLPWAPSWRILRPALDARSLAWTMRAADPEGAERVERHAWEVYEEAFRAEMRVSFLAHHEAWAELLAARERTLVCYCTDAAHCHRRLLASMLAKCGAVDMGER